MMVSVLRQELDSMVRVIYLRSITNLQERHRLITQTLTGQKWTITTSNVKTKNLTDRDMVEVSNNFLGWTKSVYDFGCAFIHLSNLHDYSEENPLSMISNVDKIIILGHLRNYHGGPLSDNPSMAELSEYFPKALEKISENLECYLEEIEALDISRMY